MSLVNVCDQLKSVVNKERDPTVYVPLPQQEFYQGIKLHLDDTDHDPEVSRPAMSKLQVNAPSTPPKQVAS